MSSRLMTFPKKISDHQFIGDLLSLFARRKIRTGDTESLENFGSELAANDALRSDLFTLCTAISHMAEADLSGEQLLLLVARALGGMGIGDGDIPESMRSAFLTGYEAWSNRGSDLNEPLAWPPARPSAQGGEISAEDEGVVPEPIAPKVAARGMRTVQEALDLARERAPFDTPAHRPSSSGPSGSSASSASSGANIENLTLSELMKLLDEIEHRVSRIEPQLRQATSTARPPTERLRRRGDVRGSERPFSPEADARAALTDRLLEASSKGDSLAPLAAMVIPKPASSATPPTETSADPFLARHAYLKPTRRIVPGVPDSLLSAAPFVTAARAVPDPAAPPAAPIIVTTSVAVSPAADHAAPSAAVLADEIVPAAASPVPLSPPAVILPAAHVPPLPPVEADKLSVVVFRVGSHRITSTRVDFRMAIGFVTAFILFASGYTGVSVYHYLHPRYVYANPEFKPAAQPIADTLPAANPELPGDAASAAHVTSGARTPSSAAAYARETSRGDARGGGAASKFGARRLQVPPVAIWPPSNQEAQRDAAATQSSALALASAPDATPSSRGTSPGSSALYVPSSRMMSYAVSAPRPIYPQDQANGIDGTVVLQVTISKQGSVTGTRTVSGPVALRAAAVQAVRAWRFKPYLLNGSPTEVVTTLELPFKGR